MSRFYSFAQWFMEVPETHRKVGKKTYLVNLFRWIPHHPRWAYGYLFIRSFIRYKDLFNGYLRILILGTLLLFTIHYLYLSAIMTFVFLMLNMVHLVNAWNRFGYHFWFQLYPIPLSMKKIGFLQAVALLLMFQSIISSIAFFYCYPIGIAISILSISVAISLLSAALIIPRLLKDL